jgi:hypothetical protein
LQSIEEAAEADELASCNELIVKAREALEAARIVVEQHLNSGD